MSFATVQDVIATYAVQPLLILFIGIFAAKLLEALLVFLLRELRVRSKSWRFSVYVVTVLAYIATFCLALASVGVLDIVLWFLLGAVTTVLVLSLLLSLKDFFPNFLAYRKTHAAHKAGSTVKTTFGDATVIGVQLLDTRLRTKDGDELYVPNRGMAAIQR